ncbi:hypothetical protein LCGC14_2494890 [marine sediment metagenome]|uniref:Uncharacterized protein n=1 Tax=marine sediment metagenome TaxID=412755 RepID=A0A0F9BRK8_9ZZZZ
MRKLIIPRGASPRLYRKLVASGEIEGVYRCNGIDDQVEVQAAIDQGEGKIEVQASGAEQAGKDIARATKAYAAGRKTPKKRKTPTGYQEGDRGFDDAGR